MADIAGFDAEFMEKLSKEGTLLMFEIYELGKWFGLSREQVDRVVTQAEVAGKGFAEMVFIYRPDYREDVRG